MPFARNSSNKYPRTNSIPTRATSMNSESRWARTPKIHGRPQIPHRLQEPSGLWNGALIQYCKTNPEKGKNNKGNIRSSAVKPLFLGTTMRFEAGKTPVFVRHHMFCPALNRLSAKQHSSP